MKEKRAQYGFVILLLVTMCLVVQPSIAGGTAGSIPGEAPAVQMERSFAPLSSYPVTPHSIVPEVTEVGKISFSVDGLGVYPGNTGTITIVKPVGSTVRKAYLMAATTGYTQYKLVAGDITIDGMPVTYQIADYPSNINSYNYMGDVTSLVKSKIDSAPSGNVDFSISEGNTAKIDGEILAVIFDDPAQTTDNTVVLLFGTQRTNGDDFNIGLATPLDLTDPNLALDFSLGISYSYQIGANQASNIDVNGKRLTSWAGGEDDGCHENGCLLTVGGVGDTTANPANPLATPVGNWRYDDELYSLLPFVATGDTLIKVHTRNPSNNDNIFFAALNLRSATAVVGEGIVLSPATATNPVGTTHMVTAKVQDDNGNPVVGKLVTFEVTAGPNLGITGSGVTDTNGQVTFSYTGTVVGTDTIIASFVDNTGETVTSNDVMKEWEEVIPVPEFIVLDPASATNPVGTSHTLTATVQDDHGSPIVGKLVTFEVTAGPNLGVTGSGVTDTNGKATFSYTGTVVGTDTIIASFVDNSGKIVTSNQAAKQWELNVPVPTPEFPTVALPLGMLTGIVFIIQVIRRKG